MHKQKFDTTAQQVFNENYENMGSLEIDTFNSHGNRFGSFISFIYRS